MEQLKIKQVRRAVEKKKLAAKIKGGANPHTVTSNRLKLLITVVNRNKAEYYSDVIQEHGVNMQVFALANGTADAKTLRYLGLTDTEKCVIFGVIQESKLPEALNELEQKFKTVKGGNGIAFTVPLTSVIGTLLFGFLSNNKTVVKEEK